MILHLMSSSKQATWGGRFSELPSEKMIAFGESISFDARLAPFDVQCSKAHSAMLAHVGILTPEERDSIHTGLDQVMKKIEVGEFEWKTELEDVHMNIEQALLDITPAAAKLHTARSRNDQIATDIQLYLKSASLDLIQGLKACASKLLDHAANHLEDAAPSYTHLQRAQPITIAHYCLAWVEMLWRDIEEFQAAHERANVCPLGSGALAGTTLKIDREFSAKQLGFTDNQGNPIVSSNSLDTVASRDSLLKFAFACAQTAIHFSRLSEDWILWASAEFNFINLPDAYTTGSSLMPQKRNPDALELTRGKSARIQGNLTTLLTLLKAQPLTYNRDLQEDKPPVFDSHDQLLQIVDLFADLLGKIDFNLERLEEAALDPMLFATDVADFLVEKGMPFRDSHHVVGKLVAKAEETGISINELDVEVTSQISPLLDEKFREVFKFKRSIERRNATGMPNPNRNKAQIDGWRSKLEKLN
ncbi:MAG: argininosuccinate lyase [Opitutales bacterium]|nr:argininosuccinate lyase [Opitutales bacterium]